MPDLPNPWLEKIVEASAQRFLAAIGQFKAAFISPEDVAAYKEEIRRVVREARKAG